MNLKERLLKPDEAAINKAFVSQLEELYKVKLPEQIKQIVSLSGSEADFYDDRPLLRGLSNAEIASASENLSVDFIGKALLPVFDVGDNNFIVYDLSENNWCLFNIVNEVKFKQSPDILKFIT